MLKSAIIVALFSAGIQFASGGAQAYAQTQTNQNTPTQAASQAENRVVIQKGDTLSGIAKNHGTTYVRVFNANTNIQHPDIIYPNNSVRIPTPEEQLPARPIPGASPATAAPAPAKEPAAPVRAATPTPAPAPKKQVVQATPTAVVNGGVWDRLAACESGGRWNVNTGNGYYGGLQFSLSSWRAVGGSGYPHQASKAEQIARAEKLKAIQGWGAWPACTAKLGLR